MSRPVRYLFASLFVLLVASLIYNAKSGPQWFMIYHVISLYLIFGGLGFAVYGYHVYGFDGRFGISLFTYLLCMIVLIGVVLQQMGSGFPAPGRGAKLTLIGLLFLFFLAACPRQFAFLKRTWVYLLAFAVLLFIHLFHAVPLAPDSGSASFPIAAGFMMGLNMFVIPRYVSRDSFLWGITLLSSAVVLIGLPVYVVGSYSFLGMPVQFGNGTLTPLFMNGEIKTIQSMFLNPNALGVVGFAGAVAAVMLMVGRFPWKRNGNRHREEQPLRTDGASTNVFSLPYMTSIGLSFFAGSLFVLNAFGMYLTNSRASYLALAAALALYFVYLVFGRRSLPYTVIGIGASVLLFLFLLPRLGISASGRFALWSGSIEAILADPSLFGGGVVDPATIIAPYVEEPASGHSPHNSYLSMFLRMGLLGGGVYLFIILGSLLAGAFRSKRVDVPALVLAFGFAVHQIFEAYTLFQFKIAAVIGSLAFGYLILDGSLMEQNDEPSDDRKNKRTRSKKTQTGAWSRPEWNR